MEAIILHPKNKTQLSILKNLAKEMGMSFETKKEETPYNPEFVNRILNKRKDGNFTTIDTTDVWGSLGFK
jgi:hypothetical protein